jgi:hypothetical protein
MYSKLFDVGQREVIVFIYVSYIARESTLYFLNVFIWNDQTHIKKDLLKSIIVKQKYRV